ncbi:MAG: tRNA 4-thiouridine(8) synthase ThiI [Mobilibacterium timonense]|nr:tRNA uracil 4-sulfurtransferase ThiI [Mobilibacterium timonense]MBM6990834.1 tRNA 4-thiouridine(8) synthase ThiI [Mobilibacterium timonense]
MNSENSRLYIVRCGEVALKGMNKPYFERVLLERVRNAIACWDNDSHWNGGLMLVRIGGDVPVDDAVRKLSKVFGVATVSPAISVEKDMDAIGEAAAAFVRDLRREEDIRTFKVKAKRADKSFPVQSPEIGAMVGGSILSGVPDIRVDVHEPDLKLFVDVRREAAYIYRDKIKGFGGLPLGTNGKGLILMSGGIDSPVAAFMMAKRGMRIEAIHFHSYPYTSKRAQRKVEDLCRVLAGYMGTITMHVINLLPIQEEIVKNCPEDETTILVRRFMMRIAEEVAKKTKNMMLITGEDLGQVASQTAEALVVTDSVVDMPVMRPLIAMDKVDIMDKAKEIGTYDLSIQPYEDCCTVFLPKHPVTKPKLDRIQKSESALDVEGLVKAAVDSDEIVEIKPSEIV